jgi:hypothetical protein
MWSGSIAAIPAGFYLCDGSNGTPNLRDRFVIGAGSSYAVGGTGGSKDAAVVSHTHTASTNSTGSHTHDVNNQDSSGPEWLAFSRNDLDPAMPNDSGYQNIATGANDRIFTIDAAGTHSHTVTVNSAGSSGTNANLPPYYALAYIMKA